MLRTIIFVCLLVFVNVGFVFAQSGFGSVTGTITDPTGCA